MPSRVDVKMHVIASDKTVRKPRRFPVVVRTLCVCVCVEMRHSPGRIVAPGFLFKSPLTMHCINILFALNLSRRYFPYPKDTAMLTANTHYDLSSIIHPTHTHTLPFECANMQTSAHTSTKLMHMHMFSRR